MVPHPTTWQNARERQRQDLLATAERYGRETAALTATGTQPPAAPSRLDRISRRSAAIAEALAHQSASIPGALPLHSQDQPRDSRVLARLLTTIVAAIPVDSVAERTRHAEPGS